MTVDIKTIAKELSLFQLNILKRLDTMQKAIDKCQSTQAQMEQGFGETLKVRNDEVKGLIKDVRALSVKMAKLEQQKPKEVLFFNKWWNS